MGTGRPDPAAAGVKLSPVSLTAGLAVLAVGLALIGLATERWPLVAMSGCGVFLLGIVTLLKQLAGASIAGPLLPPLAETGSYPPISLPPSSAILLIFSGMGILALALRARADRNRLIAGAVGAVIVVLCIGIILTRQLWNPELQGSLLEGTSLQALVAVSLLGICLAYIAWSADPSAAASAPWVPLSVGVACLITVLFLWRTLSVYERLQIRELTRTASSGTWREITRQLSANTGILIRIAGSRPKPDRSRAWKRQLGLVFHDYEGLEQIAWFNSRGQEVAVQQSDSLVPPLSSVLQADLADALLQHDTLAGGVRHFPVGDDGLRFATAVPVCRDQPACAGYIVGVVNTARLLQPVLADSAQAFQYAIFSQRRTILLPADRRAAPLAWTERTSKAFGAVTWELATWPTAPTLARLRTGLPDLLLLLGLLVSAILPVTIRLAQMNWTRARLAERVRLNLALETATDGIWEWNITTGASLRSAALWRHLGYDPAVMQAEKDTWNPLIHPADQRQVNTAMSNHLAGLTESYEAEYRIRGASDDWHWVIDRGRVVERYASGAPRQVAGISADITERKRADQAIEESERRFRASFESAQQGQMLLDLDGRVLEANRAALEFIGLPLEELRGRHWWEGWRVNGAAPQPDLRQLFETAVARGAIRKELELPDQSGRGLIIDVNLSPIFEHEGKVAQLLADMRDMTQRRRTEDTLREVESLTTMGRLAARVAHEINNPLAGIQNSFLLIKNAVPATHPHFAYVGAIEREIARIARVTRQLYETYRPEHHEIRETALPGLVADAVAMLEQINRDSQVTIVADLSRSPALVPIPDAVLRQTVYNLVQNAVEASPSGGTVELSASVDGELLVLCIRDRGPGIPAEIRTRVFEPFFTTKPSSVKTGGMGIGLALVRRSIEALGGTIEILDRAGGGTEFMVRLPLTHSDP